MITIKALSSQSRVGLESYVPNRNIFTYGTKQLSLIYVRAHMHTHYYQSYNMLTQESTTKSRLASLGHTNVPKSEKKAAG